MSLLPSQVKIVLVLNSNFDKLSPNTSRILLSFPNVPSQGTVLEVLKKPCRTRKQCLELGVFMIFGLLEADGERLFNTAVQIGPQGLVGSYRKIHLPGLGVDHFTTPGDRPFAVTLADELRVGMSICHDVGFPESTRCLALAGADLVVVPTNWPPGAECIAEHAIRTRAMENKVYMMAVNRVGTERGFQFIGQSSICDPSGTLITSANATEETILVAEIDVEQARQKYIERAPGGAHSIDRVKDRRPEMYGPIVEPVKQK